MHFSTFIVSTALLAAAAVQATWPKANEYRTTDCSGDLNYGHHSPGLSHVTMDDTTHSVYLAGATWVGYADKTGNGGSCSGQALTIMGGACNNLDTAYPGKRVKCVRKI